MRATAKAGSATEWAESIDGVPLVVDPGASPPEADVTPAQQREVERFLFRQAEILDDRRRLVRRNDIVIGHDTVSRAHAHIEYSSGEYRLFDDGSSYGTSVIHQGRLMEVPRAGAGVSACTPAMKSTSGRCVCGSRSSRRHNSRKRD